MLASRAMSITITVERRISFSIVFNTKGSGKSALLPEPWPLGGFEQIVLQWSYLKSNGNRFSKFFKIFQFLKHPLPLEDPGPLPVLKAFTLFLKPAP